MAVAQGALAGGDLAQAPENVVAFLQARGQRGHILTFNIWLFAERQSEPVSFHY
jgi:hypothetical protein